MALRSPRFPALLTALALVLVLVPLAGSAEAKRPKKQRAPRAQAAPKVVGQPSVNYVIPPRSFFSFPNRSKAEELAIRQRVLTTVRSTWGGGRTAAGTPLPTNGTIRMATWTFEDWGMAKALVAAKKRGVSVQIIAAKSANRGHPSWQWLRKKLGNKLYRPGFAGTRELVSFARQCKGACRGLGGTAHAKYFLFDNVGAAHTRNVVVQTSMNLTTKGFNGQWNQAQVLHDRAVYGAYLSVFREARLAQSAVRPFRVARLGRVVDYFFPRPRATAAQDPIMQNLSWIACQYRGVAGGPVVKTQIRAIQYAIYGDRGVWIAKRLRALWNSGCDVAVIYAMVSRPVMTILRSRSGRGPVPMRQSVIKDNRGDIVDYQHSKWLTISGKVNNRPGMYMTLTGSANWGDLAFADDEQTQRIVGRTELLPYVAAFGKTWKQKTSTPPRSSRVSANGRGMPQEEFEDARLGQGIYRYLPLS